VQEALKRQAADPKPETVDPAEARRRQALANGELLPPKGAYSNPDAVAVIIGVRNYDKATAVEYAGNDAEKVREYLLALGFQRDRIIFEPDATLGTFNQVFGTESTERARLYGKVKSTSDVFVFYSGHGVPDTESKVAYLLPRDGDPTYLQTSSYSTKTLYANLAKLPARSVTVALDACFTGMAHRGTVLRASPAGLRAEDPVFTAGNMAVFTASAAGQMSGWYDGRQHGFFTYAFLQQLQRTIDERPTVPTLQEFGSLVATEVNRLSNEHANRDQNPQMFGRGVTRPIPFIRK
jgi:hypothetical protein